MSTSPHRHPVMVSLTMHAARPRFSPGRWSALWWTERTDRERRGWADGRVEARTRRGALRKVTRAVAPFIDGPTGPLVPSPRSLP